MSDSLRVVFDCNVFLQSILNNHGPAAECLDRVRSGDCHLFIDDHVIRELRDLPNDPKLLIKLKITAEKIEKLIAELIGIAEFVASVPAVYVHPFDLDDSDYVNLAIATGSRLIVSRDRHLLDLMDPHRKIALDFRAAFPSLRILNPPAFLREMEQPQEVD